MSDLFDQAGGMAFSNNPPLDTTGSAVFVLTRAAGEIEIRAMTPGLLHDHQLKFPNHVFESHEQLTPTLWAVKGRRRGGV